MLEFIIAFLLSIGYHLESTADLHNLDSDVMPRINAEAVYHELGGQDAWNEMLLSNNTNPEEQIIVVPEVDPKSNAGK